MFKRLIRDLADRLDRFLLPLTSRSGLGASAHYLFLSRQFRREHRAVLAGRLAYERSLDAPLRSSPLLRRNVHRLEKGLVMRPRQAVFAEDYVEETVAELCRLRAMGGLDPIEEKWATDVLAEYFRVVADTPSISRARARFEKLEPRIGTELEASSTPRPRAHARLCPVSPTRSSSTCAASAVPCAGSSSVACQSTSCRRRWMPPRRRRAPATASRSCSGTSMILRTPIASRRSRWARPATRRTCPRLSCCSAT